MAVNLSVVRGNSLRFTVAFYTDTDATVPWSDLASWSPRCELREDVDEPDEIITIPLEVDGNELVGTITNSQCDELGAGGERSYVWDIKLQDPAADADTGALQWPGPGEDRCALTITPQVTR